MGDEDDGVVGDKTDGGEGVPLVGELAQVGLRAHGRHRQITQRIAVRIGLGQFRRADGPAGSGHVLDDECRSEFLAEQFGKGSSHDVRGASRPKSHDDGHGALRIGSMRLSRQGAKKGAYAEDATDHSQHTHLT